MHRSQSRLAGMALLLVCVVVQGQEKEKEKEKKPAKLPRDVETILKLTNAERAREKLPPLAFNDLLFKTAQKHSENMAKQGKMEHTLDEEGPGDRARKVGYKFQRLGENIAYGMTPTEAVAAWMKSEGHRANILEKRYTEIGIGIAKDKEGRLYHTQVFGTPLEADEK